MLHLPVSTFNLDVSTIDDVGCCIDRSSASLVTDFHIQKKRRKRRNKEKLDKIEVKQIDVGVYVKYSHLSFLFFLHLGMIDLRTRASEDKMLSLMRSLFFAFSFVRSLSYAFTVISICSRNFRPDRNEILLNDKKKTIVRIFDQLIQLRWQSTDNKTIFFFSIWMDLILSSPVDSMWLSERWFRRFRQHVLRSKEKEDDQRTRNGSRAHFSVVFLLQMDSFSIDSSTTI